MGSTVHDSLQCMDGASLPEHGWVPDIHSGDLPSIGGGMVSVTGAGSEGRQKCSVGTQSFPYRWHAWNPRVRWHAWNLLGSGGAEGRHLDIGGLASFRWHPHEGCFPGLLSGMRFLLLSQLLATDGFSACAGLQRPLQYGFSCVGAG